MAYPSGKPLTITMSMESLKSVSFRAPGVHPGVRKTKLEAVESSVEVGDAVELGRSAVVKSEVGPGRVGFREPAEVPDSQAAPVGEEPELKSPPSASVKSDLEPVALAEMALSEVGRLYRSKEVPYSDLRALTQESPEAALVLLGKLPAKAENRLKQLSEAEQSKALKLLNQFSGQSLRVGERIFYPTRALARLLIDDKLTQKDSKGNTLLHNLEQLSSLDETGNSNYATWFVVHAASPKRSYRQLPESGTCVATSLSYKALEDAPAEVSRLTLQLARDGRLPLPNGEVVNRAVGSDSPPENGGSPVEQLLQASLTDYADSKYQYDFKSDQHFNGTSVRRGRLWVDQQLRMEDALTGRENKAVKVDSSELRKLFEEKKVERMAADIYWEKNPKPSLFNTAKHGRHMVVLTGVDDKYVYFRNPHGSAKQLEDSSHKANNYGFGRFTREEFDSRLHHVILDSSLTPQGEKPVSRTFLSYLDQMLE